MDKTKTNIPTLNWLLIALCFLLSFPFYLPKSIGMSITLGLPTWVVLSVVWMMIAAILVVWTIHKHWANE